MAARAQSLLLGENLLLAARLHELLRRDGHVVTCPGLVPAERAHTADTLAAYFAGVRAVLDKGGLTTVFLTSEVARFVGGYASFAVLRAEVAALAARPGIRVVLVSVATPVHASRGPEGGGALCAPEAGDEYAARRQALEAALDPAKDLVFAVDGYVTHLSSDVQPNPLSVIAADAPPPAMPAAEAAGPVMLAFADQLIAELLTVVRAAGTGRREHSGDATPLGQFVASYRAYCRVRAADDHAAHEDAADDGAADGDAADGDVADGDARPPAAAPAPPSPVAEVYHQARCSLKVLYRQAPPERVAGQTVADWRTALGRQLAASVPDEIRDRLDQIVPVPETGKCYARGLADAMGKPYVEAIFKRTDKRSFDLADADRRRLFIAGKLGVRASLLRGRSVGIVDEAIFTGATLRLVCHLLQFTGVRHLYLFVASPPCTTPCGYNMQPNRNLLSEYIPPAEMPAYFDVDGVFFQDPVVYRRVMREAGHSCVQCFTPSP
jgi:hypothetical protein